MSFNMLINLITKKSLFFLTFTLFVCINIFSQDILTASVFFQSVSEKYGSIKDFEASLKIVANRSEMISKMSFKRPNLLRIDFSKPDTQTIVFDGSLLKIYLPDQRAILNQSVSGSSATGGMNLATPQGLVLMSRYYTIAYETGQNAVPLEEGSAEQVIRLTLGRKNTSEVFRRIRLSVSADTKLIRRIEALTTAGDTIIFDFTNYRINTGIPDMRFIYDAPTSANNYNNFLYSE
ncbi:MAG: LolA family protein [Treponemataceae bacterium]